MVVMILLEHGIPSGASAKQASHGHNWPIATQVQRYKSTNDRLLIGDVHLRNISIQHIVSVARPSKQTAGFCTSDAPGSCNNNPCDYIYDLRTSVGIWARESIEY